MSSVPGTPSPNRSESPSVPGGLTRSSQRPSAAVQIEARLLVEESGERGIARRARIRLAGAAYAAGQSVPAVAAAVGVTRQRVHQWVTAARYDYPPDDTADPEGDTAARQT